MMKQTIQFDSEGLSLSGDLYTPDDFDPAKKYPAILVTGSWTTVKEQMSGLYAKELAKQGFVTLAFDPRYYGGSEGEPRFWENPTAKTTDFKNAITYLQTAEGVDPDTLFAVSICASSGYMADMVADNKQVKAFATVAAWLHDAESVKPIYGGAESIATKISQAKAAKKTFAQTGEVAYVPTVSATDKNAAMYGGQFAYYLDPKRGAVPQWSADKFAVMSWEDWLTYDPIPTAKRLQLPVLMVHSDEAVLPDNVKQFFSDIPFPHKILHWTKGTQMDFYDQPAQVSESVAAVSDFFHTHVS